MSARVSNSHLREETSVVPVVVRGSIERTLLNKKVDLGTYHALIPTAVTAMLLVIREKARPPTWVMFMASVSFLFGPSGEGRTNRRIRITIVAQTETEHNRC